MMTINEMLTILTAANDVMVNKVTDTETRITFNDFDGFDNDWNELLRDYVQEDIVYDLMDLLADNHYIINGVTYIVSYTSDDI